MPGAHKAGTTQQPQPLLTPRGTSHATPLSSPQSQAGKLLAPLTPRGDGKQVRTVHA